MTTKTHRSKAGWGTIAAMIACTTITACGASAATPASDTGPGTARAQTSAQTTAASGVCRSIPGRKGHVGSAPMYQGRPRPDELP